MAKQDLWDLVIRVIVYCIVASFPFAKMIPIGRISLEKGKLATIHYDSALRPERSCFAHPTLCTIVGPNCSKPENLLSVLQGQRDQNVVSGQFIAVASHTIWRWNISSKLTDSMTQIQSEADTPSTRIRQFPLIWNLAYVRISRGIPH